MIREESRVATDTRGRWCSEATRSQPSCSGMAMMAEQTRNDEARAWWRKAYDVLSGMKQRGLFVSAQDEQFLAHLRGKLGG